MRRLWLVLVVVVSAVWPAAGSSGGRFVELIGGERQAAGVRQVQVAEDLRRAALEHSRRMAARGAIWHSSRPEAENVGMGPSVGMVHRAFMRSAAHRRNILDARWTVVGVGVVWRDGTLYVTELFASRRREPRRRQLELEPRPEPGREPRPAPAARPRRSERAPVEPTRVVWMLVRMVDV